MELTYEQLIQKAPHKFVGSLIKHNQFNIGSEAQRIKNMLDVYKDTEKIHFIPDEEGSNTTIRHIKDESQAYAQHQFQYELTPMTITVDGTDYQTFPQTFTIYKDIRTEINNNSIYTLNNDTYSFNIINNENTTIEMDSSYFEQGDTSGGDNVPSTTVIRSIDHLYLPEDTTELYYKINMTDNTKTYRIWYCYYAKSGSYVSGGSWVNIPTGTDEYITCTIPASARPINSIRFLIGYRNGSTILPDVIDNFTVKLSSSSYTIDINKNDTLETSLIVTDSNASFYIDTDNTTHNITFYSSGDKGITTLYDFNEPGPSYTYTMDNKLYTIADTNLNSNNNPSYTII